MIVSFFNLKLHRLKQDLIYSCVFSLSVTFPLHSHLEHWNTEDGGNRTKFIKRRIHTFADGFGLNSMLNDWHDFSILFIQ